MYHLRLKKGRSYCGGNITATRQNPDVFLKDEEKATAEYLVKSGYFVLIKAADSDGKPTEDGSKPAEADVVNGHFDKKSLEKWSAEKVRQLAEDMGINIAGLTKKDTIEAIAAVKVQIENGEASVVDFGEDEQEA